MTNPLGLALAEPPPSAHYEDVFPDYSICEYEPIKRRVNSCWQSVYTGVTMGTICISSIIGNAYLLCDQQLDDHTRWVLGWSCLWTAVTTGAGLGRWTATRVK